MQDKVCLFPFDACQIHCNGNVSFCCDIWSKNNYLGNIYTEPFEQIWNSPMAQAIRKSVLSGAYAYCNRQICPYPTRSVQPGDREFLSLYPKRIDIATDNECNLACFTCRREPFRNSPAELHELNEKIDGIMPLLKNASVVYMAGNGDPFASRHYRLLIRRIAQAYPGIRFMF